jgi:hypothetical protein
MTKTVSIVAVAALIMSFSAAASIAGITVEFSEVDPAPLTLLDGTTYFDAYGIAFEDTTYYGVDSRFIGAGADDRGITTAGPDNLMTVVFTTPVSYVQVDWVADFGHDFYTTVYDSDGGVLFDSHSTGTDLYYGGDVYQVSSGPLIAKMTFHDDTGWIGVGRIEFETDAIPAPGAILLAGIGAGIVGYLRRRRTL